MPLTPIMKESILKQKVMVWMEALSTVYNRGFWSGYYLGQNLGEWSDGPGFAS